MSAASLPVAAVNDTGVMTPEAGGDFLKEIANKFAAQFARIGNARTAPPMDEEPEKRGTDCLEPAQDQNGDALDVGPIHVAPSATPSAKASLLEGVKYIVQHQENEAKSVSATDRMVTKKVPLDAAGGSRPQSQEMRSLLNGWNPASAADQNAGRRNKRSAAVVAMFGVQNALEMMGEYTFSPPKSKKPARRADMGTKAAVATPLSFSDGREPVMPMSAPMPLPAPPKNASPVEADSGATATPGPGRPRRAAAEAAIARGLTQGTEKNCRKFAIGNIAQVPDEMFAQMEAMFRESGDKRWGLRRILRSGLLNGLEVEYRSSHSPLRGVMTDNGLIQCFCDECQGGNSVTPGTFEEHANSTIRRPTEGIFILEYEMSLRHFCYQAAGDTERDRRTPPSVVKAAQQFAMGTTARQRERSQQQKQKQKQQHATPKPRETPAPSRLSRGAPSEPEPAPKAGTPAPKATTSASKAATPAASKPTGRVMMMAPTGPKHPKHTSNILKNRHKNKRLFIANSGSGLQHGEPVRYMQNTNKNIHILTGSIVIDPNGLSGILCDHCNRIISASMFEIHAGKGARRAPYEFIVTSRGVNLKEIAANIPDDVEYDSTALAYGSLGASRRRQLSALRTSQSIGADADIEAEVVGGCCICQQTDFTKDGFDDRTIIICDQCELEHHVGCLRHSGRCDLKALPEGDWFCSSACENVNNILQSQLALGPVDIPGDPRQLQWQLLHSKKGTDDDHAELEAVQSILEESFDPIIDMITRTDLLPVMVASGNFGEWDYSGMHSMLLRMRGKPVAAAICRVFGTRVAELPLIATSHDVRRQGFCRVLLDALLGVLAAAGVDRISLPAAEQTVSTWKEGFGFEVMPESDIEWATTDLRMLRFPGTDMLQRPVVPGAELPPLRPEGWQTSAPKSALEKAEKASAGEQSSADSMEGAEGVKQPAVESAEAFTFTPSLSEESQPQQRKRQRTQA